MNSKGLRDYEYSYEKPDSVYRILVFGDSYAAALQVDLDSSFTKVLERKLNNVSERKIEVINMGVSGYGTANSYFYYISEGLKYNPDLVILAFLTGNDFRNNSKLLDGNELRPYFYLDEKGNIKEDLSIRENIKPKLTFFKKKLRYLKKKSFFLSLIANRNRLLQISKSTNYSFNFKDIKLNTDWNVYLNDYPKIWEEAFLITEKTILKFRDEVTKNQSDFLLVSLTNSTQISDKLIESLDLALGEGNYDLEKPDKYLKVFANEHNINYLQLLPFFQKEYRNKGIYFHGFYDSGSEGCDCHWNAYGHQLAGEVIFDYIVSKGLLK